MKKVWIVMFLIAGVAYPYVSNSFRYSSTAKLLLDDYDWIATDPGYIPHIEGARFYTNLSNFVNQKENVFDNLDTGYYLLGLKYSNLGLILDNNFSKISDSTGLDDFWGYGEKADTIYIDTLKTSVTYNSKDAWHESTVMDFMLGWGFLLGENKSLGISYTHDYSSTNLVIPDDNYITFREDDSAGTTIRLDSTIATGSKKSTLSRHRAIFSFWKWDEEWDLNLKLGFLYRTDNSYKGEKGSYSISKTAAGIDKISTSDSLQTSPYFGFGIPFDILAIRHLGEENEMWFNIGGVYTNRSPKAEAGKSEVEKDTVFAEAGNTVTVNSYYNTITGTYSDLSGYLFTKGVFQLSDRLTLGMGLRVGVLNSTDSSYTKATGSFLSQSPIDTVSSDTSYSHWAKTTTGQFTLSLPVAVEFHLIEPLAFRLGATYIHTISDTTVEEGVAPTYSKEERRETLNNTLYTYGLGYKITDNLQIDLMGFSNLLNISNWKLSLTLKF